MYTYIYIYIYVYIYMYIYSNRFVPIHDHKERTKSSCCSTATHLLLFLPPLPFSFRAVVRYSSWNLPLSKLQP